MRSGLFAVVAAVIGLSLLSLPADAQTKKKRIVTRGGYTVFVSRDENGRTRTRVLVQKRSYLDGGTEVLPGERKYSDYVNGPGNFVAFRYFDNTAFSHRHPLPGPFDLPGRYNPGQF